MKDINDIIKDYWAGKINAAEKQLLLEMLNEKVTDLSDEEYRAFTQLVNEQQTAANREDAVLNEVLKNIEVKLEFKKSEAPVYAVWRNKWKWVAAASIVLVMAGASWFAATRQSAAPGAAQPALMSQATFSNNSNTVKDTLMPDGSIIRLYPQTAIRFTDGFMAREREIFLNGKAIFKVAKDTSRPFIVYAGGFSTKALGTQFEVNTNEMGKFLVKLMEGKVVIKAHEKKDKPFADVYLTPGQELVYDIEKQKIITGREEELAGVQDGSQSNKTINANNAVLAFSKLPLQVVLNQLEEEFSITIIYDAEKISDKVYTGIFDKSNTPPIRILRPICKEYGWKVKFENNAYVIK